ncbi:hypothetical protein ACFWB3_31950 [[Kitasatospora] papulosa]|uniref:hypothetical protein n=1 Tax=[Kitasatospora] papulosa TaxID=1464011 RepID=UPI0036790C75
MTQDNPAARLQLLLMDLHRAHPSQQQQQQQAWVAACTLLDVEPDSPAGLQAMADVTRLPDQVIAAITEHVDDEEERQHLLEGMPLIRAAMRDLTQRQPIQTMFARFAPGGAVPLSGVVRDLASCSRLLNRAAPASVLSESELDHLQTLITGLMEQIVGADLPADLRLLLLTHVRRMQEALQFVRIGGREAIQHELDAVLGAVIRRPEARESLREAGLLDKFKTWVDTLNGLLAVGTGSTQLAQTVARAIEM